MESFKAKTGRSKINHNASFKGKFCLCFKPVSSVDDDDAFEPADSFSTILSSALMADCREGTDGWRRFSKKKGDHNGTSFWQILKKAFNNTTLLKKIKTRKAANKSKISRSSINMKLEKNSKQECKSSRSLLESRNSSLFTRSSLSSSTNSSSSSQTIGSSFSPSSSTTTLSFTTPKLRHKKKGTNPDDNRTKAVCYILVTSLLILILWGKVFAIICISFWLYFLPRRSEQSEPLGPAFKEEEEFDTVEYKKKVIMEGLLERDRSRLMSMDSTAGPS